MQTIEQVREDHASIEKVSGDRCAVIVKTAYRPRKFNLGVQFWTTEMIAAGKSENTDGTTALFVDVL